MLFPLISDGDFALAEDRELEVLRFGMLYVLLLFCFVTMCGLAVVIRGAHIDTSGVLARAGCHLRPPDDTSGRRGWLSVSSCCSFLLMVDFRWKMLTLFPCA